jgi:hypothetical protein
MRYYYLGEWLESVRVTALGAWRLSLPLEQLGAPQADATAARQFRMLVDQDADAVVLGALARLEATLDTNPSTRREVVALVELLENIIDILALQ